MLPKSGRDGYLKLNSGIEVPLYSWQTSVTKFRPDYRTAKSDLRPVRTSGLPHEILLLRGVQAAPPFNTSIDYLEGQVGWLNLSTGFRTYIPIKGLITRYQIEFVYQSTPLPSINWSASLIDYTVATSPIQYKEILVQPIFPLLDSTVCVRKLCDFSILLTNSTSSNRMIDHVKRATITTNRLPQSFVTAKSLPRLADGYGPSDTFIDLEIEGDFDYWYEKVYYAGVGDLAETYNFFFNQNGIDGVVEVPKMRPIEIGNILLNIQTSEMISATVRLAKSL